MTQCPTCGATVSEQADFCEHCGMELASASTAAMSSPSESVSESQVESPSEPFAASLKATSPPPSPTPSAQEATSFAQIILKRNNILTKETFQLWEYCTVGRFHPDTGPVDIDLGNLPEGEYVSRHHAEFGRNCSGRWFIKDLDTSNGTYIKVAGTSKFQKVAGEQAINDGDEIALGNARFEFRTI